MSKDLSYPDASEGITFHVRGNKLGKRGQDKIDEILADTPTVSFGTLKLVVEACKTRTTSGVRLSTNDAEFYSAVLNQIAAGLRPRLVFSNFGLTYREFRGILDRDTRLMDLYKKVTAMGQEARSLILEDEAQRRAVEGVDEPVYYKGKKIDTKKDFSDALLSTMLKAHAPDRYADRSVVEHGGTVLQLHIDGVRGHTSPDEPIDVTPIMEGDEDETDESEPGEAVLQATHDDEEPDSGKDADGGAPETLP